MPAFLLAATDDPCCAAPTVKLLQMYRDAGVTAEAHSFQKGGHGFNMGQRSSGVGAHVASAPGGLAEGQRDYRAGPIGTDA